ncbi:MAG TPA: response regulator transcription factor [Puia sp.]|uniref:response regulator transcription factor n=1 Tax=Puia sp. TaxID=2045100 RepID=UPI002D1AA8B9|nr:response regulator transcription factor [Puia sp.]HVU97757.1 response regulator transcription factor [Puia sp.]
MDSTIRIGLVDDHILLRDALGAAIDGFVDCRVTLLASNGKELISQLQDNAPPQLLILDVNMPELGGYETARWLREHCPNIPILILTMYDSEFMMIRLLQLGVRGFLKKDIHPSELRNAIKSTMTTGYYYSGSTTVKIAKLLQHGEANVPVLNTVNLTENEIQFLRLASTEMTYKEISAEMKISPRTVDNYRDSLFVKLHVKSRVGLVLFAIENGIVVIEY